MNVAVEVPGSSLPDEEAPLEIVEFEEWLQCKIIGLEDLIIDRLNSYKYWKYEVDCEMVELLLRKYHNELDWEYLERRAKKPENDTLKELIDLKERVKA